MGDEEDTDKKAAEEKRAAVLREQIASFRRGDRPKAKPGSIRDAIEEAIREPEAQKPGSEPKP